MKIYSSIHLAFCVQKSLLFLLDFSELIRAQAHSENNFYDFNIIHCDFSWPKSLESTPNKSKSVAFRSTHAQRQKLFFFFACHSSHNNFLELYSSSANEFHFVHKYDIHTEGNWNKLALHSTMGIKYFSWSQLFPRSKQIREIKAIK